MVCTIFCAEILTLLKCEQQMSRDRVVMSNHDALVAEPCRLTIEAHVAVPARDLQHAALVAVMAPASRKAHEQACTR